MFHFLISLSLVFGAFLSCKRQDEGAKTPNTTDPTTRGGTHQVPTNPNDSIPKNSEVFPQDRDDRLIGQVDQNQNLEFPLPSGLFASEGLTLADDYTYQFELGTFKTNGNIERDKDSAKLKIPKVPKIKGKMKLVLLKNQVAKYRGEQDADLTGSQTTVGLMIFPVDESPSTTPNPTPGPTGPTTSPTTSTTPTPTPSGDWDRKSFKGRDEWTVRPI